MISAILMHVYLFAVLSGRSIKIHTIEIPSDNPVFLTLIAIHVLAAMVCVIAGLYAMLAKKQHGKHSKAGTIYYYGLWVVFITVIMLAIIRWQEDYRLLILGALSFGMVFMARRAIRLKWNKWPIYHVTGMGLSYIVLLTAFYVDNGRFLPVWKDLPVILYWTLPAIIGIPVILVTLRRHPIVKNYKAGNS